MSQEMPARPDGSALDRDSLGDMRRSGAIAGMMGVSFVWGFATEILGANGELWLLLLAVVAPLVLLLTVALAVSPGEKVSLPNAVVSGVLAGGLMGMMFALGFFSPFALALGGRDLIEFGGDFYWYNLLIVGLIMLGAGGAVVGAVCGVAAWALHIALGQKPVDSEVDMKEGTR